MNHLKLEYFEEASASELTIKMVEFYREHPGIGVVNIIINSVQENYPNPKEGTREVNETLTMHYAFVHYIEGSNLTLVKSRA